MLDRPQKRAQLGSCLELRDRVELLQCRRERVGKAPHGPWLKLGIPGIEVKLVDSLSQVAGSVQFAFDKGPVDDQFGRGRRELLLAPGFHLSAHGLKAPLHAINPDRKAVL